MESKLRNEIASFLEKKLYKKKNNSLNQEELLKITDYIINLVNKYDKSPKPLSKKKIAKMELRKQYDDFIKWYNNLRINEKSPIIHEKFNNYISDKINQNDYKFLGYTYYKLHKYILVNPNFYTADELINFLKSINTIHEKIPNCKTFISDLDLILISIHGYNIEESDNILSTVLKNSFDGINI